MHSNLRFPYAMVTDPDLTALVTSSATAPEQLTVGQVGIFNAATQKGLNGAAWTAAPVIFFAQNIGDTSFGVIRTKDIDIKQVKKYYGQIASNPQAQIGYYGWNGTDGDLILYKGQELGVVINIYNKDLAKWYGKQPYTVTLPINLQNCAVCESDCERYDPSAVADEIVATINGTNVPTGMPETGYEFKNFFTAEATNNGLSDASEKAGVKLTGIVAPANTLSAIDPLPTIRTALTTFSFGTVGNCNRPKWLVTQVAKAGKGYPAEIANEERESQGYDRQRNASSNPYVNKPGFIILAKSDKMYDGYVLDYDWAHHSGSNAASPAYINERYAMKYYVPRAKGTSFEAAMNAWLAGSGVGLVDIDTTTTSTTTTTTTV